MDRQPAAGSLVVLLAWVYYDAQIFLLGAEFTKVYADERGSPAAARATDGTRATAAAGAPPAQEASGATKAASAASARPGTGNPLVVTKPLVRPLASIGARVVGEVAALAILHVDARLIARRRKGLYSKIFKRAKL